MKLYLQVLVASFALGLALTLTIATWRGAPVPATRFLPASAELQGPGYLCKRAHDGALECIDLDTFLASRHGGDL